MKCLSLTSALRGWLGELLSQGFDELKITGLTRIIFMVGLVTLVLLFILSAPVGHLIPRVSQAPPVIHSKFAEPLPYGK